MIFEQSYWSCILKEKLLQKFDTKSIVDNLGIEKKNVDFHFNRWSSQNKLRKNNFFLFVYVLVILMIYCVWIF